MRLRPAVVALVIGVLAVAGCRDSLGEWRPQSSDVVGSWTSPECDADLVLARDGTLTARNLRKDDLPAISGSGTWRLAQTPATVPGVYVFIGETRVILDPLTRDDQPILLDIVGDITDNRMCWFVRGSAPGRSD
jgi:hypothetical protein